MKDGIAYQPQPIARKFTSPRELVRVLQELGERAGEAALAGLRVKERRVVGPVVGKRLARLFGM